MPRVRARRRRARGRGARSRSALPLRDRRQDGRTRADGAAVSRSATAARARDTVSYALAVMEMARADASVAITLAAHVSLGASPFYLFGTEAQKQQYLVPLARGEKLWGFGLTEPNAGSDAGDDANAAPSCATARWIINGTKAFITNSGTDITGGTTITAVTGIAARRRSEISNLIVPQDTPGFARSKKYRKMGWRASDTRELSFADAAIPEDEPARSRAARASNSS